ncbi:MAG: hypothetical protein F4219_07795 [Gammaproteobacteria bacterium]|nr:hypothetical protein [Gammaproteobacteria bacterium]
MKFQNNWTILFIALVFISVPSLTETLDQVVEEQGDRQISDDSTITEQVTYVTSDNFEREVLQSDLPVLVVFTAPWCGPCKILDPVIESLMPDMSGEAKVFKLDTDVSPEISTKHKVTRLPTIIFFNNGQEKHRASTIYPRDAYVKYLQGLKNDISIENSILNLLDRDWFRRHFLVTEEVEYIEQILEIYPEMLTKEFDNGQTPLSLVLNYPSRTQRDLLDLVLAQDSIIGPNDLLGVGRCEEFERVVADDPDAINRPDPDGYTPLFTAIMGSGFLEHGECVNTVLELGAERSLQKIILNSLGESVAFQPDGKLVEELLDLLPMKWGPKWHNDDVGVKKRLLTLEMYKVRTLRSEDLIARRPD